MKWLLHDTVKSKNFQGSQLEICGSFYHIGNRRQKKNSLLVLRKENIHSVMSLCGYSRFPFISATYLREKQRMTIYLPHLAFKQLWYCHYHFPAMSPQLAICFLKISPGLDFQSGQIS